MTSSRFLSAVLALATLAAPSPVASQDVERTLLDALSVGDRIIVNNTNSLIPGGGVWIQLDAEGQASHLVATPDERKEFDALMDDSGPPPGVTDPDELRAAAEKRVRRRIELERKVRTDAGEVTDVGADFLAYRSHSGRVIRLPVRALTRLVAERPKTSQKSPRTEQPAETSASATTFLHLLRVGDEVVLKESDAMVEVLVGMQEELGPLIPTPEERLEYEQLSAARHGSILGAAADRRLRAAERVDSAARLIALQKKIPYQSVRLTEVGKDFLSFASADGFLTSLPAHRIGSITRRTSAREEKRE